MSVAYIVTIIKVLNNIVQSSIQIAGESSDKASRNLTSMCRNDDENNEIYTENYKSDLKNSVSVAAVTIDGAWQKQYGLNPLLGVAFVTSVDTGGVEEFEGKCKHCFECRVRSK